MSVQVVSPEASMRTLRFIVLLCVAYLLVCVASSAQQPLSVANPWTDARFVRWAAEFNAGHVDQELTELETDLLSGSPHPFAADLWCILHLRLRDLDAAAAAATPRLKSVLGRVPEIYSLNDAGRSDDLVALDRSLTPPQRGSSLTYLILVQAALARTENDRAFALGLEAMHSRQPAFIVVWATLNAAEYDSRVWTQLQTLLQTDQALAGSPQGQALRSMMAAENESGTHGTNCSNRTARVDNDFMSAAQMWLKATPDDPAAYAFQASHLLDLNSGWQNIMAVIDKQLDIDPVFLVHAQNAVAAALSLHTPEADTASDRLAQRIAAAKAADTAAGQAQKAIILASAEISMTGCDRSPRWDRARQLLTDALASSPDSERPNLLAERAEVALAQPFDPARAAQALADARAAETGKDSQDHMTLLLRALEFRGLNETFIRTDSRQADTDVNEALSLYRAALGRFHNDLEALLINGDRLLGQRATCAETLANDQRLLAAYPTWNDTGTPADLLLRQQDRCIRFADEANTFAILKTFYKTDATDMPQAEALWAETEGLSSLADKRRAEVASRPSEFLNFHEPDPVDVTITGNGAPPDLLRLEVQTAPMRRIAAVSLSDDLRRIVTAEDDGTARIWSLPPPSSLPTAGQHDLCIVSADVSCPHVLQALRTHVGGLSQLALSHDNVWLLTAGASDGTFALHHLASGAIAWYIHAPACVRQGACDGVPGWRPGPAVVHFALSPAGTDGTQRVAVLIQRQEVPLPGATSAGQSWSSVFLCHVTATPGCTSFSWFSKEALSPGLNQVVAWSADAQRVLLRVSLSQSLLLDAGSMKLIEHWAVPADAAFGPDLRWAAYIQGGRILRRDLSPDGRTVNLAPVEENAMGLQLLADGRVRYLLRKPTSSDTPQADATTPAIFGLYEIPAAGASSATLLGSVPSQGLSSYSANGASGPQFVLFARELALPDGHQSTSRLSFAYFAPEDPTHPIRQVLEARPQDITASVLFSADGRLLFVSKIRGNENQLHVWDLADKGRPVPLTTPIIAGDSLASEGSSIFTCDATDSAIGHLRRYAWGGHEQPLAHTISCDPAVALSKASGLAAISVANVDGRVSLVGADGVPHLQGAVFGDKLHAVAGGRSVGLAATYNNGLYRLQGGQEPVDLCGSSDLCPQDDAAFAAVALDASGGYALAALGTSLPGQSPPPALQFGVLAVNLDSGALRIDRVRDTPTQEAVTSLLFLPNSTTYLAGTVGGSLLRGNAASGGALEPILKADSPIRSLAISSDGRRLALVLDSGAVLLAGATSDGFVQLAQLYDFDDGDWCVVRPNGQFDASNGGQMDEIVWIYGTTTLQLDQMLPKYYRAGLLPRLLGFQDIAIEPSPSLNKEQPILPPSIRIVAASSDGDIDFLSEPAGVPIGSVKAYLNGSWVNAENIRRTPDGHYHVSIAGHHAIASVNDVQIIVGAADPSTLESRSFHDRVEVVNSPTQQPPQFYAIIAGISDYPAATNLPSLKLTVEDALEIARDVALGAHNMLGDASRVHLVLLTSDEQRGRRLADTLRQQGIADAQWMPPTHAGMLAAFTSFESTSSGQPPQSRLSSADTFLLFLAGHGILQNGAYAYPTSDFNGQDGTYFSGAELKKQLLTLGASHAVLLFDTCAAGAFVDSARTDLGQLRLNGGTNATFMLMGAGADASAFGASQIGHGLLTAGLLLSIRDTVLNGGLEAVPWLRDAGDITVTLARQFHYEQYPLNEYPSRSLEVGVFPSEQLRCIPDVGPPMVTEPNVTFSSGANADSADFALRDLINDELRKDESQSLVPFRFVPGGHHGLGIDVDINVVRDGSNTKPRLVLQYLDVKQTLEGPLTAASQDSSDDQRAAIAGWVRQQVIQFASTQVVQKRHSQSVLPSVCLATAIASAQ
jgi:WD40 repeat protein